MDGLSDVPGLQQRLVEFETIAEGLWDAVYIVDAQGIILTCNTALAQFTGYSLEELRGLPSLRLYAPDAWPVFLERRPQAYGGDGVAPRLETRLRHKDGRTIPVELAVSNFIVQAQHVGRLTIVRDLTAHKQREERLQKLLEAIPDAVVVVNTDGRIVFVNLQVETVFGYHSSELLGQSVELLLPESFRLRHTHHRARYMAHPRPRPMGTGSELYGVHKDGHEFPVEISLNTLDTEQGLLTLSAIRDISARQRAEKLLQQQCDWLDTTLHSIGDGVIATDAQGVITRLNPVAERLTGWSAAEAVGQPLGLVLRLIHTYTRQPIADPLKAVLQAGHSLRLGHHTSLLTRQGQELAIDDSIAPMQAMDGTLQGIVCVFRDVTERRQIEEQLRQTQKMQAIGTLAGGIAHDFNNILSAIFGYTELALLETPPSTTAHAHLQQALIAAQRARDLVEHILTFSRKQSSRREPLDLAPLLREVATFLRASLPATIAMELRLEAQPWFVQADATQIHQVLMNLCTNAGQAMQAAGGRLHIALENVQVDATEAARHGNLKPGPYVRLRVQDTGPGMTPEVLERLFEPFFTTKATGQGTGLGLAVAHGIVREHDGAITVESTPGQGSTFAVYLPQVTMSEPAAAPAAYSELPHGHERLLLVDDDLSVARMGQALLTRLGYAVTLCTSSTEALETFRAHPDHFDLIITDYTMPQMTGEALVRACREIRQDIPCLLCTGFSETMQAERARQLGMNAFLSKPWDMHVLAQTLRQVLTPRPA
ncbi:MAG: PAS domain S-box protein [Candidatus Tectimicrobiota bacterium]